MDFALVASNVSLIAFAAASIAHLLSLQRLAWRDVAGRIATGLFWTATAAVTVALAAGVGQPLTRLSGVLLTAVIAWLTVLAQVRFGMRLIGAFVAPLATMILLLKAFISTGAPDAAATSAGELLVRGHMAMAIIGQAFAIIACAISVLFLWQRNLLKKKMLDQLPRNVPAIDRLEALLMAAIWCGFIFITLGLLSGAIYVQTNHIAPELWDRIALKVVWAAVVWLWYLAILLARNVFNRPGKRVAQMSLLGFLLLAFTFFGMGIFRGLGGAGSL